MEASDFFTLSEEIFNRDSNSQASLRTVVNCAYYAMYHTCLEFADHHNLPKNKKSRGVHSDLINRFTTHKSKKFKNIGDMLKRSKYARVQADYVLSKELDKKTAESVIAIYTKILREIQQIDSKN